MTKYAAAKKYRMLPPYDVSRQRLNIGDRTHSGKPGDVRDVERVEAAKLEANGWTNIGPVGPSTDRPPTAGPGDIFHDRTLDQTIFYDGKVWRDPVTGASV